MRSIAPLGAAFLLVCVACGEDDAAEPVIGPGSGDGSVATTDGATPTGDASTAGDGGANDVDAAADAASQAEADAGPGLVLEIPKSIVECGGAPCETLDNVCCESWSKGTGFAGELSCVTAAECDRKFSRGGEQNRSVHHECDDKDDCSAGQVCCFYAYGQPLCELGDLLMCVSKMTGPGGSRICADNDACQLCTDRDNCSFIGSGSPIGVLSCTSDRDCADRPGTSCQPEQNDSATTGKGVSARSYVKVCR